MGRPARQFSRASVIVLQSTPHMRGATSVPAKYQPTSKTSIHAPHAWGDLLGGFMGKNYTDFNPRPTCVGRLGTFMATPMTANFNPRPPCVGRREPMETTVIPEQTSIHAPYAWGDLLLSISYHRVSSFNPRPTCVGRRLRLSVRHLLTGLQTTPHMRGATVYTTEVGGA